MISDIHISLGASSSSTSNSMPYKTYYFKNKVQFVLTTTELSDFGIDPGNTIHAITLKPSQTLTYNLNNFRIRLGQTKLSTLSSWITSGLTLVFQGNIDKSALVANTTYKYTFTEPYEIGEDNLIIEISRDDTGGANAGGLYTRVGLTSGKMIGSYCDSGYSYPFDTLSVKEKLDYIIDVILTIDNKEYKSSGKYETPLIEMTKPMRIVWDEIKPDGTDILVEWAKTTEPNNWIAVSNMGLINSDSPIYICISLTTDNIKNTPVVKNLWFENHSEPRDKMLLTMKPLKRFCNVEGELTVGYDSTNGNLKGEGGKVESFAEKFEPRDLEQEPNPCIREYLSANISTVINVVAVEFKDVDVIDEHLSAGINSTIALLNINDDPI